MEQKSFKDLNLSNVFLFSAAMNNPETCQLVLECIFDHNISNLHVHTECSMLYSSDFKCIRLDVLGQDELEVSYDLEMQNHNEGNLPQRSRYYQAELDLASLKPGQDYTNLKPLFVIFICNFDPFNRKLYRYTFEMQCKEIPFPLEDGATRIFLNIGGKNPKDVPDSLLDFLGYLNNSTDSYVDSITDSKVKKIHENIKALKRNRNLEEGYMRFEELMQDNYKEGLSEGLKAMVNVLSNLLPDLESVYQNVISNDVYRTISREQVELYYNQCILSKDNSVNQ